MVHALGKHAVLSSLLEVLVRTHGGYELLGHFRQDAGHDDLVVRLSDPRGLPGSVLVIATAPGGRVREVLCFKRVPDPDAIARARRPGALVPDELEVELEALLDELQSLPWTEADRDERYRRN